MHEAALEQRETGLLPADDGWFILNLAEIGWESVPGGGTWCGFESPAAPSPVLGIGVHVLWPGESPGLYHAESGQEGFLVLSGECTLVVEEEERTLRQWDYFHCPSGTRHITVGGAEPCVVLMIGARPEVETLLYPVSEVAAKYGASVAVECHDGDEAYVDWPGDYLPVRLPWPLASDTRGALTNRSAPPVTVTPVLTYPDVRAAVAWLESAFGFEERVRIGEGHRAQLRVGADGAIVVAEARSDRVAPGDGVVTQLVKVRVPDVDVAFARAREAGARVLEELTTWEYGERSGVLEDLAGHRWELTQTVRDVEPEEWGGTAIAPW
jgi:uncharacterized glyoxalase superfamily protein PhnB/quercetin dioxygenase-like cupin family protein